MNPDTSAATKPIRVLLIAPHLIIQESIKMVLEENSSICVTQTAVDIARASRLPKSADPQIVSIYLSNNDQHTVDQLPELFEVYPQARTIVLADGQDFENQARALRAGAAGIVQKEQNARLVIEAIKQVHKGETWINQKLLSMVLSQRKPAQQSPSKSLDEICIESLTERESEVITLIGKGLKNKDIASELFISEATVRHHLSSIYSKLGVDDRLNLVIFAYQHDLVSLKSAKPVARAAQTTA